MVLIILALDCAAASEVRRYFGFAVVVTFIISNPYGRSVLVSCIVERHD